MRFLNHWVVRIKLASMLFACALAVAPAAGQGTERVVPDVLTAWENRQKKAKVVRYEIEGEWFVAKEHVASLSAEVGAMYSGGPIVKRVHYLLIVDFANRRGRFEEHKWSLTLDQAKKEVAAHPSASIGAWDGDEGRGMKLPDAGGEINRKSTPRNPDMFITKDRRMKSFPPELLTVFWGHGSVSTSHGVVQEPECKLRYEADVFSSNGEANFRGIRCNLLKTQPVPAGSISHHDVLWTDPRNEAAVLRRTTLKSTQQLLCNEEAVYHEVSGASLVKSWVRSTFRRGKLVEEYRLRVVSVDADYQPMAADFELEPKPGMFVQREAEVFRVEPSGRWTKVGVDPDMEAYYRDYGRTSPPAEIAEPPAPSGGIKPWLVGITVAVVALLLGVFVFRRKMRRRD